MRNSGKIIRNDFFLKNKYTFFFIIDTKQMDFIIEKSICIVRCLEYDDLKDEMMLNNENFERYEYENHNAK